MSQPLSHEALLLMASAISLSMARIVGCAVFLPFFGKQQMGQVQKLAICMALSLIQYQSLWEKMLYREIQTDYLFPLIIKELLIGVFFGLLLTVPFWMIRSAFTLVDNQRGANAAQMNNPAMPAEASILGDLMERLLLMFLINSGLFVLVFDAIYNSYQLWPAQDLWPGASLVFNPSVILSAFSRMITDIVLYSAPILLLLLCIEFGMAIASSAVQGLDVYSTAMPIKSLVAVVILVWTANTVILEFAKTVHAWWVEGVFVLLKPS